MTTFLFQKFLKIPGVSRQVLSKLRRNNIILEQSGLLTMPDIEHETFLHAVVEGSDLLSQSQVRIGLCAQCLTPRAEKDINLIFSHLI